MIEGKNIILRQFRESDLDEYFRLNNLISERGEHYPLRIFPEVKIRKMFEEDGIWSEKRGNLLITDKSGRLLGDIGFFSDSHYIAGFEVGYQIFLRADRGKGYATEALKILTAFLFESKEIPRLFLATVSENIPSKKVAEKCGFKYDGTMRKAGFCRGELHDIDYYSLMREECPSLKEVMAGLY